MRPFYATFLPGQAYHGGYVEIFADSHHAARAHMFREHSSRWADLYTANDFQAVASGWGLTRILSVRQRPGKPNEQARFDIVFDMQGEK